MKGIKIFTFLLLTIGICFPVYVSAVKAYPFPIEVMQPNGEAITIQTHGDEFFHYTATTDGYVVAVDDDGYFTFAEINDEGNIQPGKVRVSGSTLRNSNQSFLKTDSPEFLGKIKKSTAAMTMVQKKIYPKRLNTANTIHSAKRAAVEDTKVLVILAEFTDMPFSVSNPQQVFTNILNQPGYSPVGATGFTGSVRDYFMDSSDDRYKPNFIVYGPVQLPNNMAFYGANEGDVKDKNAEQMIIDACKAANKMYPTLNLADFPMSGDGSLFSISVIYAGYNEAESAVANTVWPHQFYLSVNFSKPQRTVNGVVLDSYMCTSELRGRSGKNITGIGTFTHEYSHILGLPDFYDVNESTDGIVINEPGNWDIMSNGNYLNSGNTPPSYSAIERWIFSWMDLYTASGTGNITIYPLTSSAENKAYVVETPTETNEFFTLEVRKKENWDSFLPGEGMLIHHIDMSEYSIQTTDYGKLTMMELWGGGIPNISGNHPGMKLMTANREVMTMSGNNYSYKNYAGHPFPGANRVTSISDYTNPGFLSWKNEKSGVTISNIVRNSNGSVSFRYSDTGTGIKENNINAPSVFSKDNIVYFKNISGNVQVNIYDLNGTLYLSKNIYEPNDQEIAVPGIYIVKLQTINEVFTYKVIIR